MLVLPTVLTALNTVKGLAIGVAAGLLSAHKDYLLATLAVTEEFYL
jgi:demethoxyubiquinone hydroxylase (CLK1/Coq7/Cat5 family)